MAAEYGQTAFPRQAERMMGGLFGGLTVFLAVWVLGAGAVLGGEFEGMGRDAFPVFNNPRMLTAQVAEETGQVFARDAVIGVRHNGEAKAYPISVMGIHELGNDTIGGKPIAVSW